VGENLLAFEGAGYQDTYSLDFTNVELIRQGDNTNTNLVVNGDFQQGPDGFTAYSIPGWIGSPLIEKYPALIYNGNWGPSDVACELNAYVNYEIIQKITFDSNYNLIPNIVDLPATPCSSSSTLGSFTLEFDWAATTANNAPLSTSQGNVVWNNIVIETLIPSDGSINHASFQVSPSACIINSLQFDGASTPDGIGLTISNVQIFSTSSNLNAPTFSNGNFQQPSVGAGNYQLFSGSIPGWQVVGG